MKIKFSPNGRILLVLLLTFIIGYQTSRVHQLGNPHLDLGLLAETILITVALLVLAYYNIKYIFQDETRGK